MANLARGSIRILENGLDADSLAPVSSLSPSATFEAALLAFVARVVLQGREVVLVAPHEGLRRQWLTDMRRLADGETERASILISAALDGLVGGVLVVATRSKHGGFDYAFSTHT